MKESITRKLSAAPDSLRRAKGSVRAKLLAIVLVTTAIAALVAGLAMLVDELMVYRSSWATDLATEAKILSLSTAPALAFDDHASAARNLAALDARPGVLVAALYGANGRLYASYVRAGEPPPPAQLTPTKPGARISGTRVQLVQNVSQNGELLGTIYLQAHYDLMARVRAYLGIFTFATALSLSVALVLSRLLQRVITEPLDEMASVARQIVDRRDYSLRVQKKTDDEFGLVVEAFNNMLHEVQRRARALEQSNAALRDEVQVRQAAETALARANTRLESTMAAAEIGSWVWDLHTNEFTSDRNFAALFGLDDERALSGHPDLHHRQIHPEDLQAVIAAEEQAMRTGILASTDFRVIWPQRSVRWIARRGRVRRDEAGTPASLSGVLIDITAQKLAEDALRASEKLYRAIGESIDYGVWISAPDGRNIYASESFLRLTGLTQERCSNDGWVEFLHPADLQPTVSSWQQAVRDGVPWYCEHRILGTDGAYHPILAQSVPMRGEHGEISGWAGINLDISRLKATEQALRDADRRKDEFLATLAHELRNPLAPIRHAVQILGATAASERQREWGREVIARQAHRMALLLDDLLDVSRITRGRLELRNAHVELESLVAQAIETAKPLLDAKGHRLRLVLPSEPITLDVDPLRISQALSNLLTNAAKYTDAGGQISLTANLTQDELAMTVTDTGIGLERDVIPTLFEMFSQVDSAVDRAEGGLGIGLALVRG